MVVGVLPYGSRQQEDGMAGKQGAARKNKSSAAKKRAVKSAPAAIRAMRVGEADHDVLHGPAKAAIYAAVTKRLRTSL